MASDKHASAFDELGLQKTVEVLLEDIAALYKADEIPWVVGYSGGKDSTAVLQLVWLALKALSPAERHKPVLVISTDTLVENPIVAAWVTTSHGAMCAAAKMDGLPMSAHRLTPALGDTYWVNLIGKGYPAPRPKFRWCTERLKIRPSNRFITDVVRATGEAILVLGTRKAESSMRASRMKKLEKRRTRKHLSPNKRLPNSLVFSPIEDWTNDDVWLYLMQFPNPWGYDNKELLTMYQGASADGECPLVVDTTTPSCGSSRFGCWVCTLVERDKSMQAMIQNDEEKEWMLPLLEFRDELGVSDNRHLRDFRRMSGAVQLFHDRPIPGPYKQEAREMWLRKLLEAQQWVRANGPDEVRSLEFISLPELQEVRRIWVVDKHEVEDSLPGIYEDVVKERYPGPRIDDNSVFGPDEMQLLREVCGEDELHFGLTRELLTVVRRYRTMARRAGLYDTLEDAFRRSFYENEEDAVERARRRRDAIAAAQAGQYVGPSAQ